MTTLLEGLHQRIDIWATRELGRESLFDVRERARRLIEEATEFAQAAGVTESEVLNVVMYVYRQKTGVLPQELAGVLMTTLAAATAIGADPIKVLDEEITRVENVPSDMIAAKQHKLFLAGVSDHWRN